MLCAKVAKDCSLHIRLTQKLVLILTWTLNHSLPSWISRPGSPNVWSKVRNPESWWAGVDTTKSEQHKNKNYKTKCFDKLAPGKQYGVDIKMNKVLNLLTSSVWQVGPIWDVILSHGVHDGPESVEGPGVEHVLKEVSTFTSSLSNQRHQVVGNIAKDFAVSIHHLSKKLDCYRFVKKNF